MESSWINPLKKYSKKKRSSESNVERNSFAFGGCSCFLEVVRVNEHPLVIRKKRKSGMIFLMAKLFCCNGFPSIKSLSFSDGQ